MKQTAILLMGPTASGKTDLAISLCKRFPCDVISVDSALVYRGMDIGTAKPDPETLARTPHRLIDIREPEESYSAGEFVRDAYREMDEIFAAGRIPLLVGGTMMYFRALTEGIAALPSADEAIRRAIDAEAAERGWPALHEELQQVDPAAAQRIKPNDRQRIQRALEVYRSSGQPLSDWQRNLRRQEATSGTSRSGSTSSRERCCTSGSRSDWTSWSTAVLLTRCSGSGNGPAYGRLSGNAIRRLSPVLAVPRWRLQLEEARDRALFATRQLAKRQITWLRSETKVLLARPP